MSDQVISQVRPPQSVETRLVQQMVQASAAQAQVMEQGQAVQRLESDNSKSDTKSETKPERRNTEASTTQLMDVFLKFQFDDETHNLTIFVLDKGSHEIIRTIPPEEISKMSAGQLVELFI